MLLSFALAIQLAAANVDCVRADKWVWYEWKRPFAAAQEEQWRQAVSNGNARAAYELLKSHGKFIKSSGFDRGKVLCDAGLSQYDVLTRLTVGAQVHVMPDAALTIVDHMLKLPALTGLQKSRVLARRACLLNHGAHDEAIADVEQAMRLSPGDAGLHAQLAYMLGGYVDAEGVFRRLNHAKKVIEQIELALELGGDRHFVLTEAVSIYAYLPAAFGGDGRRALVLAREKVILDPVVGNWDLGRAYQALDRHREAERHFLIALDQVEIDPLSAVRVGISLADNYVQMRRKNDAFDLLYELKERYPQFSMPLYRIGLTAAVTRSRHEEGKAHLQAWLEHPAALNSAFSNCEFSPNYAFAHYRLGQLHDQLDEIAEARAQYQKALENTPDLKEAELALLRLPRR